MTMTTGGFGTVDSMLTVLYAEIGTNTHKGLTVGSWYSTECKCGILHSGKKK